MRAIPNRLYPSEEADIGRPLSQSRIFTSLLQYHDQANFVNYIKAYQSDLWTIKYGRSLRQSFDLFSTFGSKSSSSGVILAMEL